ncbi:hypothetical protein [Actinomadura litoris]|uniref:hypothetical protein n=1 Tax=Actinomadura litoris TaxID=2678616 RepID=UPI001FA7067A|nr:hypothetical protein [Actinomadura litoris]
MATTLRTPRTEASLKQEFALLNAEYAELLAHVRAAVAAARDGELDLIAYLVGFLEEHGQLPPAGVPASRLVAEAFARAVDADCQLGGAS